MELARDDLRILPRRGRCACLLVISLVFAVGSGLVVADGDVYGYAGLVLFGLASA